MGSKGKQLMGLKELFNGLYEIVVACLVLHVLKTCNHMFTWGLQWLSELSREPATPSAALKIL